MKQLKRDVETTLHENKIRSHSPKSCGLRASVLYRPDVQNGT